ncbi:acyl-CoA thioesterase [Sorangium sp. So ce291]|uniref:acyl-CoA thioesterase n=1 Tax=unclassified Sorangium TaxID=2621164 RepID=UPI002B8A0152|nr:acyl-CoA thioesterase [Sorangium sp.]
MVSLERPIKFEDVDAASIVFFARFLNYAHEAMERFFAPLEGGYAALILGRRIGLPAVRVEAEYAAPVRYGETLRIETSVVHLGRRSATFRYRMVRAHDGVLSAELRHTVVTTDLEQLASTPMPEDVRALLSAHLEPEQAPASAGRRV